jgi:Phage integrase family
MARQRRPDLTVEQARHLLEVIEGERLEAFYVLALTTGLRRGELLGLRWADVDLNSRQLYVRRALQRVGGKLRFVEPKTSTSLRAVVMPKLAVRHLARHRARQDAERLARGAAWKDYDLVFASSVGTPIEPRNVNRRWDELRERTGLDWLRLHDLRHGCATFMKGRGVASDATLRAWREDSAVRDAGPSAAGRRSRRPGEPAGQGSRDRTLLSQMPGCCIHSRCIRVQHDAARATKKRSDEGRRHHRPVVTLTYSAWLVNRSLPVWRQASPLGRSWKYSGTRRSG